MTLSNAFRPRSRSCQLLGVLRSIVHVCQQDIFKRQPTSRAAEVFVGRLKNRCQSGPLVDRDQLISQLIVRGMQRDGQMIRYGQIRKSSQRLGNADRRDGDSSCTDRQTVG